MSGHAHDDGPQPTVYALQTELKLDGSRAPEEVRAALSGFAGSFVASLEVVGCRLIGHVKGMLEAPAGGSLTFSVTTFAGEVRLRGALGSCPGPCRLTLNAIVYGVGLPEVERAALGALDDHFGPPV